MRRHTFWKKHSQNEIKERVFQALDRNVNYAEQYTMGIPASYLDEKVFNQDATFLSEAPYLSTLIQNPNHIGCHTLGNSESYFTGTQALEKELIEICAVDILQGNPGEQDGYVASGGTEANIQALWIYRNLFLQKYDARLGEICIICSSDSHYSMDKGSNLLGIDLLKIEVEENERGITRDTIQATIQKAKGQGKKHLIVVCNMMTTMFGSVDDIDTLEACLNDSELNYRIHVDGAYGGFYYPFSDKESKLSFKNTLIDSFTLDAHKIAQAPYGTGVFLIRKDLIQHAGTKEATYVEGNDFTLIGSRSGANAVAAWMILVKNGPYGWQEKIFILQKRTEWMCQQLKQLQISFYRNPYSNIITINSAFVEKSVAKKFGLVPDDHKDPQWFKIVVMEHVTIEKLSLLLDAIKAEA
jgi:glutamate/tyrosine decarboxylase-like PLP-dependent enzyme